MSEQNYIEYSTDSESETCNSDDSQNDPTFDILQDTQSKLSNLSIDKKSKSRVPVEADDVFNANDEKSFEIVQKIIEGGMIEKLKVDQCKLYLRKHRLRLTGKKDILVHRIKEHISIMKGEGELKYPPSSFVMNCKGDACTGDVVMFEQNVYEMFNIASRSGGGPPCGKRIVAGRIVKESYGAAKQQHTFTIEVLWSKGEKPLPPLHPLLIKGRNLYRLKTVRQKWEDESQRRKILSEKHDRGNAARNNREVRLHEKETKKALRENRASKGNTKNETQEKKKPTSPVRPNNPMIKINSRNTENLAANRCPLVSSTYNHHGVLFKENINHGVMRPPIDGYLRNSYQIEQNSIFNRSRMFEMREYDRGENTHHRYNPPQNYSFQQGVNNGHLRSGIYGQRQQLCRYYAQGRCHYGTNCKYLH